MSSFVTAILVKKDREKRGVGNQGFRHAPDIMEFAHIMATHSPSGYRFLSELLPLPQERTLQRHRAKVPHFPVGITERTFDLVVERLRMLQYDGPVALSCDDTKLLASFRPYWDEDRQSYVVLGATGEPVLLTDPSEFEAIIEQYQLEKATKLRLFVVQVPLPKVSPIIVAVLGITNLNADALFVFLKQIVDGLLSRGVKVRSYACDGTAVERSVQKRLDDSATRVVTHIIDHPGNAKGIQVKIHYHGQNGDQPIGNMQDSLHGKKSGRNGLYSGARGLTFPNDVAKYSDVKEVAAEGGPIYWRDVEKVDRQDDRAAARLFSGQTLEWLVKHHPEHLGTIVYLFIISELIDAYQNRHIPLVERVQMVLRAHFFMEFWERYLDQAGYSKYRHFISHDYAAIIRILIDGFLEVLYIYRDDLGGLYPLILWLLSSEPDEHIFGVGRKIVPDFHMLNFYQSLPKMFIRMREALFSGKYSDSKLRASGYHHLYMDVRDIDLSALADYPTNVDINRVSKHAYQEAENLFALLGVTISQLNQESSVTLPSIRSWLDKDGAYWAAMNMADNDTESIFDNDSDEEDDEFDIQMGLDELEKLEMGSLSSYRQEQVMQLRCAAVSLALDEEIEINSLPELATAAQVEAYSDDAENIAQALADSLPAVKTNQAASNPFAIPDIATMGADLSGLVELRYRHQTKATATGTRTVKDMEGDKPGIPDVTRPLSEREKTYNAILDGVKMQLDKEHKGVSTGLARGQRWTGRSAAPGGRDGRINGEAAAPLANGNSANAAAVATTEAKKVCLQQF
ncbi:hypothetical protein BDZ89DRAFT_1018917 [Hymenopellis radicata]|nr:hypothetical protein BDZ89DRAFT_1018917 [Hymenopellis radicata]